MMNKFRLLFFGSIMTEEECFRNPDCPFSANRFQLELVSWLAQHDLESVSAICPTPTRSYPEGSLLSRPKLSHLLSNLDLISPFYVNLGPAKILSLVITVLVTSVWQAARTRRPDFILLYNPYLGYAVPALILSRLWQIPAVAIIADMPAAPPSTTKISLRSTEARLQRWAVGKFDALLPFSIHVPHDLGFQKPFERLDPGVSSDNFPRLSRLASPNEKTLLFSGTLNVTNGLGLLLDAFKLVVDPSIQLLISGRGEMKDEILDLCEKDRRVRFLGFLSREELLHQLSQATVLVNPRPASLPEHRYNFPSKIVEYLAIGRPVISTKTADVAEEYGAHLILLERETPQALAALIEDTFHRSEEELQRIGDQGRKFVLENKNWDVLGQRVALFLKHVRGYRS